MKAPAKVGQRTLSNVPSDALTEEIKLASEFQNPFPCQVEGCPNFHDDEKTCLCKEHVGAFTIAHAPEFQNALKSCIIFVTVHYCSAVFTNHSTHYNSRSRD